MILRNRLYHFCSKEMIRYNLRKTLCVCTRDRDQTMKLSDYIQDSQLTCCSAFSRWLWLLCVPHGFFFLLHYKCKPAYTINVGPQAFSKLSLCSTPSPKLSSTPTTPMVTPMHVLSPGVSCCPLSTALIYQTHSTTHLFVFLDTLLVKQIPHV